MEGIVTASDEIRVAYYGALFAMADIDGSIDKDEFEAILEVVDFDGLSPESQRVVRGYFLSPPSLAETLAPFREAEETLRFSLMVNLVEIAWANDVVAPEERQALIEAQEILDVSNAQLVAIDDFVRKVRVVRARGLNDNYAADAVKRAAAGLLAVGIPIAAVYFSGTVIGLSAAGITSGLAALGLGFGMVPGIGVAIIAGTIVFVGLSHVFDIGGKHRKEKALKEAVREAQIVIRNLQQTMDMLVERDALGRRYPRSAARPARAIAAAQEHRGRCRRERGTSLRRGGTGGRHRQSAAHDG
jgi:uncharacterized tellurite resistance protein B-like protein